MKRPAAQSDRTDRPDILGWVFQFNGKLQFAEPQDMIDTYKSLQKEVKQ